MRGVEARLSRVEETPTVEANSPEALLNWLRESLRPEISSHQRNLLLRTANHINIALGEEV